MCGIFPNLALWGMTFPYNYMSHLGGRYQACTMPFDWTPQQAFSVRNIFNPAYQAFSFIGAVQNNFYASMGQNFMQNFMQIGYNAGISCSQDSTISGKMGEVGRFVDSINSGIESDKLTKEQKEKMENLKRKAESIQRRLQDVKVLKSNGADLSQVEAILDQINADFSDLKAQAQKLAEEIKEAQAAKQDGDESSSGSGDGVENDDDTVHEPTKDEKYEASKICSDIDNAIFGPGTNYELLLGTMQKFTGNNVMTILDSWDKSYAKVGVYAEDTEGFIETLMDDCEFGQKKEIATLLVDALEKRAMDLGIDVTAEVGAARNAMQPRGKWYTFGYPAISDTGDICRTVNALIKKIRNNTPKSKNKGSWLRDILAENPETKDIAKKMEKDSKTKKAE